MRLRGILIMALAVAALGVVFYFASRPAPPPPVIPRPFVWSVDMDQLKKMVISLPRSGKSQAWVEHDDKYWYFDQPQGPKVDMTRWGGGVPLLLSGPGANRLITENVTDEQMKLYGLADPLMRIELTLQNGDTIDIMVGDATPDGQGYYIRRANAQGVYTVDYTWYGVLEGLVLNPPYPKPWQK